MCLNHVQRDPVDLLVAVKQPNLKTRHVPNQSEPHNYISFDPELPLNVEIACIGFGAP